MEEIQKTFLQQIERKLPENTLLVRELMEILHISKSEAYNKMRGDSLLTLPQVQTLCSKFGINFTIPGLQQQHLSEISFSPFHSGVIKLPDHIRNLRKTLSQIHQHPSARITCATDDIPFFHLFRFPELTAFKLHFWQMRTTPNAPFYFDPNDWKELLPETESIHQMYKSIPSAEVWTKSSLLNSLEQIKYARETGIIYDMSLGKEICKQLREAIADIEKYAINHAKSADGKTSFDWYFYEIIGSITYLVEMEDQMVSFLRFNTFNTAQAWNQPICKEVKQWLKALIADSTGFSGQGSVQRNKYLSSAYDACDDIGRMFN